MNPLMVGFISFRWITIKLGTTFAKVLTENQITLCYKKLETTK